MPQEFFIRPAKEADIPKILNIYEAARQFMAENGNPDQWTDGYPDESVVRKDLGLGQLYVCAGNDEILGVFCYFEGIELDYLEIYDGAWQCGGPYGVVHRIAVTSKCRGIASFCLNYAFSRCGNLRIDTHRNNLPMQITLAKNGFIHCGTIHCGHGGLRLAYQRI